MSRKPRVARSPEEKCQTGFEILHMLEIEIDYRDGLVAFKFDSNRYH
jgi:hypothetical protein